MNKFRLLFYDLKRAFTEPAFWLSVGFIILIFGISIIYIKLTNNALNSDVLFRFSHSLIFPFAAPLLCCIPYSSIQLLEQNTGYNTLMLIKIRREGYAFPRFFVCGIIGAAALFIPQIFLFVLCMIIQGGFCEPYEYIKGSLLSLPFGFAYSVFAYSLTFYNQKRYIPIVFPQVLYMLCIYAFPHIKLNKFYPPLAVSPWIYGGTSYQNMIFMLAVITVAAVLMTFFGSSFSRFAKIKSL